MGGDGAQRVCCTSAGASLAAHSIPARFTEPLLDKARLARGAQAFTASTASSVAPVVAGLVLDLGGGYGGAFAVAGLVGAYNLLPLARRGGGPETTAAELRSESDRPNTINDD
jgi:MFS family permease